MNFKMIRYTLGIILKFEALFFLVPIITALCYGEHTSLSAFSATAGICLFLGYVMSCQKPRDMALRARDGFVIVSLSWIVLSLFGAVPFVLSGAIPNYVDALFETVSGFTTTGASIIDSSVLESLEHAVLIWRSFTHWVGGMGVLVFVMAILPLSGAQNMHIMRAESPGPDVSKLVPRVRRTAIILYIIYFALTLILFLLLLIDGVVASDAKNQMGVFDALCTAFGTAGTGGFGVKGDSIASYSPYVQIICTVFMLLFSINFNSYYLALRLKLRDAFNSEVRAFLLIVFVVIAAVTVNIFTSGTEGATTLGEAIRHSAFTVSSLISTTGFATLDFNLWPEFSKLLLVLIMFIGACAGSTGGGIKVSRIIILVKGMGRELGDLINPKRVKKITIDKKPVSSEVTRSVNAYIVTFFIIFAASMIFLAPDGGSNGLLTNFTAITACINNIGPGLDMVGPSGNFAFFSPFSKLVLIFDMLAGRLELFPMLILFAPATWKRK
ncbi:MAG: TrkH family potassium uptake protein [Clostridia bacterium]|nr:TrkH family potassium uptake protein [Clostridia bacterium]